MQLELKHLAPYLPYGLKAVDYRDGIALNRNVVASNIMTFVDYETKAKIVLRPLNDLNKNEFIDFSSRLKLIYNKRIINDLISGIQFIENICYVHILYLIENHFDVFGLIEKKLAIDINTI